MVDDAPQLSSTQVTGSGPGIGLQMECVSVFSDGVSVSSSVRHGAICWCSWNQGSFPGMAAPAGTGRSIDGCSSCILNTGSHGR
jgi:hypothetical protein